MSELEAEATTCTVPVVENGAEDVVHMLWIGEGDIPDFHRRCIFSWAEVGNPVHLWLYPQQQGQSTDWPASILVRDANTIIPLAEALDIGYYHGFGSQLRWPGWSTFSDLFRYELLFRHGGWWCDADSLAVRPLSGAAFPAAGAHVFATERWRPGGYRNIILAVPKPGTELAGSRPEWRNGGSAEEAKAWREARSGQLVDCCVLTNSHIRAPKGSPLMRACADELRPLMEAYASQCRSHQPGDEELEWALPTGGEGLRIFQEVVASQIASSALSTPDALATDADLVSSVQHYAVFNPVEIDDFPGAMRILQGERHLPAATCAVHFFGLIRDNWKLLRFQIPPAFNLVRDNDNGQLLVDIKKVEGARIRAERQRLREAKAAAQAAATAATG